MKCPELKKKKKCIEEIKILVRKTIKYGDHTGSFTPGIFRWS